MPEDLIWCRKHTKFREKTLLRWFRRFRAASKNGEMTREEFLQVFKEAFPIADTEAVAEIVFEACDMEQLDFKVNLTPEFLRCSDMDHSCTSCNWTS